MKKEKKSANDDLSEVKFLIEAFEQLAKQENNLSDQNRQELIQSLWITNNVSSEDTIFQLKTIIKENYFMFGIEDVIELSKRLLQERRRKVENDSIPQHLMIILQHPNLFKLITEEELDKKIVGEIDTRQTIFLCSCGRLVSNANPTSFNLMVNSESGAGKDHVTTKTLEILPDKQYIKRTRISPTAFTYWHNSQFEPNWSWNCKVCYLEDISDNILNHEVFKVMCSSGSNTTVVINQKAVDIHIEGKPVMIITTASGTPNNEMIRRFTNLNLNESKDQTIEVVKRQAELASKGSNPEYDEDIIEALSNLKRVKVKIPFSQKLTQLFPADHLIMRTHFNRFLDYIKASATLHQYQRQIDSEGFIIAEGQDYDIARIAIIKTTSNQFMIPLTKDQKQIIEVLRKLERKPYAVSEIEPHITLSQKWLYINLNRLTAYGILKKDRERKEDSDKLVMVFSYIDLLQINFPEWKNIDDYCRNHTIGTSHTISTIYTTPTNTKAIVGNEAIVLNFEQLKEPIHHFCHSCGNTPCWFEDSKGRPFCSKECIPLKK